MYIYMGGNVRRFLALRQTMALLMEKPDCWVDRWRPLWGVRVDDNGDKIQGPRREEKYSLVEFKATSYQVPFISSNHLGVQRK